MKVILFCCCILFINNIFYSSFSSWALKGGHREYNANLSSVVFIEIKRPPTVVGKPIEHSYCTGTIISESIVLTSAPCFRLYYPMEKFAKQTTGIVYVRNQKNKDMSTTIGEFKIVNFKMSEKAKSYLEKGNNYLLPIKEDLVVVKIFPEIKLEDFKIIPAELPKRDSPFPKTLIIAGYTSGEYLSKKGKFRWAKVNAVPCKSNEGYDKSICRNITYDWAISNTKTTQFDQGGPGFDEHNHLVGVSNGLFKMFDGKKNDFVYYVRVSDQLDFIENAKKELKNDM